MTSLRAAIIPSLIVDHQFYWQYQILPPSPCTDVTPVASQKINYIPAIRLLFSCGFIYFLRNAMNRIRRRDATGVTSLRAAITPSLIVDYQFHWRRDATGVTSLPSFSTFNFQFPSTCSMQTFCTVIPMLS